jgi:putative membrane protein
MKRVVFRDLALRSNHFAGWAPAVRRVLFWLFVTQCMLVWARLWTPWSLLGDARWPEGLLLVLTTASLIASLARHLPGQNVMLVAIIIAFIGGAAQSLGAATGVPFGPFVYTERFGQKLFSGLPWAVPLVWIAAVFVSRGVARLILRPWRRTSTYGFRLIGLTLLLVVLLDVGWEVFAVRVKQYWFWQPTKLAFFDWYGTPVTNFLGWAVATLLILAFATPCLINKKPMAQPPPDYSPLAVWLLLSLLFATGAAVQQLWLAAGVISGISLVLTVFAVRGARW